MQLSFTVSALKNAGLEGSKFSKKSREEIERMEAHINSYPMRFLLGYGGICIVRPRISRYYLQKTLHYLQLHSQ